MSKRQGPRLRQPSFTDTATADDSDVDGTSSTDDNVSLTRTVSTSLTPTRKKFMDEERELSLPRLKPSVIPESSTLQSCKQFIYINYTLLFVVYKTDKNHIN